MSANLLVRCFDIVPGGGSFKLGDHTVERVDLTPDLQLSGADLVVLPGQTFQSADVNVRQQAAELLFRRIISRDSDVPPLVCFLYEGSQNPRTHGLALGIFLQRWAVSTKQAELGRIVASEFSKYLQEFRVTPGWAFTGENSTKLRAIATVDSAAFVVSEGERLVYVLPANIVEGSETRLMASLVSAIQSHAGNAMRPDATPIVDSFTFEAEKDALHDKKEKEAQLQVAIQQLGEYGDRKDILFLRDDPLSDRLPIWLEQYLGCATFRRERYHEDFWIVGDNGWPIAICEAKGLSANVKRVHITQLVQHREQYDLPDNFPSILLVNTFANADTVADKDKQRVGKLECEKAHKNNVLVVRTLDLLRLLDQIDRGLTSAADVRQIFLAEAGWLRARGKTFQVLRK